VEAEGVVESVEVVVVVVDDEGVWKGDGEDANALGRCTGGGETRSAQEARGRQTQGDIHMMARSGAESCGAARGCWGGYTTTIGEHQLPRMLRRRRKRRERNGRVAAEEQWVVEAGRGGGSKELVDRAAALSPNGQSTAVLAVVARLRRGPR